ncbi:peroxisomal biogenesis factor 11 [Gigaspora rosea]|uniref:Peroxisomal biogenesis factor 11 n=1 Tax=Gigaspora rosea TaxID=44941 RepID=A0A397VCF6_9GLOM|nr:peroxisomal biogenesis factor 11 [Gigaspora rosea]
MPPPPSTIEILRRLLVHSDGRDKTLKIIQYFGKIILWLQASKTPKSKYGPTPRLKAMTSQFSTTRKIIRLAHFIEPYSDLCDYCSGARRTSRSSTSYEKFVHYLGSINAFLSILNDLFDDLYCLGKIDIIDKSIAKWAEPKAIKLWFFCICLDIHETFFKIYQIKNKIKKANSEESEKYQQKLYWLNISLTKLIMDFLFCGYDFFGLTFSDGVQAFSGFFAGILSFYKLWDKETQKLIILTNSTNYR